MICMIERVPADVDEKTFTEVGAFLVVRSRELTHAPVDMNRAMEKGYAAMSQGMTLIARHVETKEILGTLALVEVELAWCVDAARHCLADFWFVIDRAVRGQGISDALRAAAAEIGKEKGLPVFVFKRVRIR